MEKEILITELKFISNHFFQTKDYIRAGQINIAIDAINELFIIKDFPNSQPNS